MPTEQTEQVERIYIREAAEILNRRMATLRKWEQLGVLPQHLLPQRGHRGWRYWTPDQIEGLKAWIRETERIPGKGLPHYNPTEAQLEKTMSKMRRPRKCVICGENIKRDEDYRRVRGNKPVHTACLNGN